MEYRKAPYCPLLSKICLRDLFLFLPNGDIASFANDATLQLQCVDQN